MPDDDRDPADDASPPPPSAAAPVSATAPVSAVAASSAASPFSAAPPFSETPPFSPGPPSSAPPPSVAPFSAAPTSSVPPPSSSAPIPEALRTFLGLPSTQDLILRVVLRRIFDDAPQFIVDDLVSNANFACMTARRPPDDPEKTAAWVAGVTVNTVRTYFRRGEKHVRWLNREVNVEDITGFELAEGPVDGGIDARWLLETWLDPRVAKNPTDRMTLEIIRHKARTAQTDEQVVAHFCLSNVSALSSRIHYFKKKYLHQRQRYLAQRRRTILLLLKIGAAVLAGLVLAFVVWALWPRR